ncbi:hypothetical protein LXA43DRAFT_1118145 [Ganoderma leucocontextum]|nr:hypothetical protein LXA43DRAFT_1118145 [Ganoderma leucocontextum]
MPPHVKNRKDDVQASAATQPNAEVTRLQKELQLCNLRLSQMRARLIDTLDELDASRNAHRLELKAEKGAKEKLSEKLDRYLDEVKRADAERDDMRDVVSILVEKVEACNDYSAWPYARMSLARPLELYGAPRQGNRRIEPSDYDRDLLHTALLESVHKRLEDERRAHTRTKQEADAEILRLRAMVARRDAELEACTIPASHQVLSSSLSTSVPSSSNGPPHFTRSNGREHSLYDFTAGPSRVSRSTISNERAESVVSLAGTRERTLEREVAFLQGQLQQARVHRSRTLSSDPHVTPISRTPLPQPDVQFEVALAARSSRATSVAEQTTRGRAELPPSPQIRPQNMSSSPSDYLLTPANARTPSRPEGERNPSRSRTRSEVVEKEAARPVASGGVDDLRHQINILSSEIDGFGAERDALKKMLAAAGTQEQVASAPTEESATPEHGVSTGHVPVSSSSHGSCIREIQALRENFDELTRQTAHREQEMRSEIDSLRQALVNARAQQREPPDDDETRCAPGDPKVPIAAPPPSSRASPHIPPAPRVPSPIQHPETLDDVPVVQGVDNAYDDDDEEETKGQCAEATEDEIGSEMDEQSMELATPLHPTILSLADDDLIIPPPVPPSLASSTSARADDVEPSDIPLPISPDGAPAFSPSVTSSLTHPHPQSSSPPPRLPLPASGAAASLKPLIEPPLRVSSDLLTRAESAAQARVAEIEREVDEVQRDLDARTRELEAKNAALAQLRAATAPWLHSDAGSSGGVRGPRESENTREGEREREGGRGGDDHAAGEGDEVDGARGDAGGGAAVCGPPGLR